MYLYTYYFTKKINMHTVQITTILESHELLNKFHIVVGEGGALQVRSRVDGMLVYDNFYKCIFECLINTLMDVASFLFC